MKRYLFKFGILWKCIRSTIACPFILSRLVGKFPTCHFYPGVSIDNDSLLGSYNVIFKNVIIHNSEIGDHTFIQKDSIIINASIGKFCSIASSVSISLGKHPTSYVSSHPAFYSVTQPIAKTFSNENKFEPFDKRTKVGNDVWIGQNVLIMDGINIGTGAIVAAGAVVTKDVPEYAIVAGVPAKLIRFRFNERVRNLLLESQWWNWSEEDLKAKSNQFVEPEKFFNNLLVDKR